MTDGPADHDAASPAGLVFRRSSLEMGCNNFLTAIAQGNLARVPRDGGQARRGQKPTPAGPTCVLRFPSPLRRRYAVGPAFGLLAALTEG